MAGQLTDLVHSNGSQVLASSHYALDVLGRRTAQTREDSVSEKYGYDTTSQLTSVDYGASPAKRESFVYDPIGNRTSATYALSPLAANLTPYTTNAINQYSTVGGISFVYDANGNLLNDGMKGYAYDAQNHLIAVEGASTRAEFYYDPRNRCVLRKYYTKGSQSQWVLDQAQSVALTYDSAGNLLTEKTLVGSLSGEYVFGLQTDEILTSSLGAPRKSYYPLADGLGSTVALSNDQGTITERMRYDVYGTPRHFNGMYKDSATSGAAFRFLFTGREWLNTICLNDHRNRYYSPQIGRWLSIDPLRFTGGLNHYSYVANSPAEFVDPSGMFLNRSPGDEANYQADKDWASLSPLNAANFALLESSFTATWTLRTNSDSITQYGWDTHILQWDPTRGADMGKDGIISPATQFAHEVDHAVNGSETLLATPDAQYLNKEEARVITVSEKELATAHKEPIRTDHSSGKFVKVQGPTSNKLCP